MRVAALHHVSLGDESIVHLTFSANVDNPGQNVALGKPSLQSSTLWQYSPDLAVDSNTETCSFTPRSSEQRWWQVHLGSDSLNVQSVAVTISPGSYQKFTIFVIGKSLQFIEVLTLRSVCHRIAGGQQGHVQAMLQVRWHIRNEESRISVQRRPRAPGSIRLHP